MTATHGIPPIWSATLIALAVVVGLARLWHWQRSAPAETRAAPQRLALLAVLQTLAGAALFFTLHPPVAPSRDATMVVATRSAPATTVEDGEILVALPEAGAVAGAERVPDLATALRRHPGAARLRVLGEGLPARDRESVTLPVDATDRPPRNGFVEIALPPAAAPGETFAVGGRIGALPSGTVELIDPAGTIIARAPVGAGRRFVMNGAARAEGLFIFELRLRDAAGRLIERLDVPLQTRADPPPRVVALAGAPGPEINFLRRWAVSAGVNLAVGIDLGAGVRIGEAPPRLTSAELARTDLLIVDDRSWETLDAGARGLVARAVEGGMGLLLMPTAALTGATRREWAVLGAPISGDGAAGPLALPGSESAPDLGRWALAESEPDAVSIVRAPDGSSLASWRARGRGRIGVWTLIDSYVLALAGRAEAHADLWSDLFSALGRPLDAEQPRLRGLARAGDRAVVCGVGPRDTVRAPDGPLARLQVDPKSGPERCAAFWPSQAGWSLVGASAGPEAPVYVHPAEAAPSLRSEEAASWSAGLVGGAPPARPSPALATPNPALAALLILLAALWFMERRRPGPRPGSAGPGPGQRAS